MEQIFTGYTTIQAWFRPSLVSFKRFHFKVRWPSWLWRQVKVLKPQQLLYNNLLVRKSMGSSPILIILFAFFVPFTHDDANMLHGEQFDSMFLKLWWLRRCAKISDFSLSRLLGRSREIFFPRLCFLSFWPSLAIIISFWSPCMHSRMCVRK